MVGTPADRAQPAGCAGSATCKEHWMPEYRAPRGTYDILPDDQLYWRHITDLAHRTAGRFGYRQLDTPIFEDVSLFTRGIQEGTDIVDKEIYMFKDRGDDVLALRPEFTAGTVRAYIEHGMHTWPQPVKVYSMGPIFRYDRPQAGRYRQFYQFNVEAVGSADPAADFEIMSAAWDWYESIGLKGLSFQINSIGDKACRPAYIEVLRAYYVQHLDTICEDCKRRLETNPLRVLDCKNDQCQPVIREAPRAIDFLCEPCAAHFAKLRTYLEMAGRPYIINNRLVRGLAYYTRTVFEVWASALGAQSAVCGGGRYDDLAQELGGRATPAVGFAAGMDRVVLVMRGEQILPPPIPLPQVLVAYQGGPAKVEAVRLTMQLRAAGVRCVMTFDDRSLKAQLKQAGREAVRYVLIIGEQEFAAQQVAVKSMLEKGEQANVDLAKVVRTLVDWLAAPPGTPQPG